MSEVLAILSALIIMAGAPPYLLDIFRHKTKPERAAWFIWSVLGVIALVAQVKVHGGWSLLFVGLDAVGNILVFVLSLRFGVGGWKRLDKIALTIAAAGLITAFFVRQPVVALIGVVLADLSGVTLTIVKTFKAPETETTITWFFLGTSALLAALSVGKWQPDALIYPVYLALANYGVVASQLLGRAAQKTANRRTKAEATDD